MKHVWQYKWCPAKIYKSIFRAFKMVNITEEDVKIFVKSESKLTHPLQLKL